MDKKSYMDLSFGPRWPYVSCVRGFILNFCAIGLENKLNADKISLAASELVENAVKYASKDDTRVRIELLQEEGKVVLEVENQATKEQAETLRNEMEKINEGTPLEAYLKRMQEAATRPKGKAGLGLARVRYEAGALLSLTIIPTVDDNLVIVKSIFNLKPQEDKK
jgi:hypothetical protein